MSSLRTETERFIAAWMEVRQIVQSANFNRFHQAGVSATQFMTLNVIPAGGISLSDLARKLNLSPATLSQTVNSLEMRRLVRRAADENDRRKIRIVATAAGQGMQNHTAAGFERQMAEVLERMSVNGRRALLKGLEEFVTAAKGD